jgi:hypothetical protein
MPSRTGFTRLLTSALVATLLCAPLSGCAASAGPVSGSNSSKSPYRSFTTLRSVTIQGYSASAMEPFISRDGQFLFFNTSNVPPNIPSLQFATRIDAQTFKYQGQVAGVNRSGVLSGTPTMDRNGMLYFISPRSYPQTLSTVYAGQFASGQVAAVQLVSGVSGGTPGVVDFDVEVSPDGATLYVSVGHFSGGSNPDSASLAIFDKTGTGFIPDPHSAQILHSVNQAGMLTYAASVSTDGLELFFTRASPVGGGPSIYRAVRKRIGLPFGHVQRVGAATGFVEAPSISADGTTLYFHRLVGTHFEIESAIRP